MEFELISCIMGHFMLNIDFQNCICYNADRLRDIKTSIASTPFLSPDLGRQRIDYIIIATHILLFPVFKITYMATTSYTALYRLLSFRHMLISKNAYRWSGTFRQITLMIFGDFVYWFFLLTCSAFRRAPETPEPIVTYCFLIWRCRYLISRGFLYPHR